MISQETPKPPAHFVVGQPVMVLVDQRLGQVTQQLDYRCYGSDCHWHYLINMAENGSYRSYDAAEFELWAP